MSAIEQDIFIPDAEIVNQNFFSHYKLRPTDTPDTYIATGSIHARTRGPEMMRLVMETLQKCATEDGITIIHEFEAENPASLQLIQQFPQYLLSGRRREDIPNTSLKHRSQHLIYVRTYTP